MSRSGRGRFWPAVAILLFLALMGALFALGIKSLIFPSDGILQATFGDKIAIVRVNDVILDSEDVVRQVKRWRDDDDVKAIVLRINSPGGAVAPSQEIYSEIKKAALKKPVVASMSTLAASGGYYIATACKTILAEPGTITGSIGVIMEFSNFEKLMDKVGLHFFTITSGKFKDTGSPFRKFNDDDKKLVQAVINDVYEQFVEDVAEGRNMKIEDVRKLADGRIYTGRQAVKLKLVDRIGGAQDAIDIAAKMAGIKGEPIITEDKKKHGVLRLLLGEDFESLARGKIHLQTGIYYLWRAW